MKKVACIVVTYNRRELLRKCIEAVLHQTFQPSAIYVIDNASTDGTDKLFTSSGTFHSDGGTPAINYIRLKENTGGAGGFYTGMRAAYESKQFDAYWVMDDDGCPDRECLENLVKHLDKYDYLSPMVIDINNESAMAFEYCGSKTGFEQKAADGIVKDIACPFNGILYSQRLVSTIGFPKKEMYIWGDEENYNARAVKAGYRPVTVIAAVHRHPANRVETARSLLGPVDIAPQMWRCYCRYRNAMYNHRNEMSVLGKIYVIFNHIWYYLIIRHSIKWCRMYVNAVRDGMKGDFSKLNLYKDK